MQNVSHMPAIMLRLATVAAGMVAVFCMKTWTRTKPMSRAANSVNSAMMRPSFHGYLQGDQHKIHLHHENNAYLAPPHCKARSKQMIHGKRHSSPSRSSFCNCCMMVNPLFCGGVGFKMKTIIAIATAPIGRLTAMLSA
jgi:hypothetical protein